jgi:hypothetical protein
MHELVETDASDLSLTTAHYRRVLDLLAPRWPAVDLVLRHRRDPTPLGTRLAAVSDAVDDDVFAYLVSLVPAGVPEPLPSPVRCRLALLARLLVGAVCHALETLAEDPEQDADAAARTLSVISHHSVTAAFEELFPEALAT